MKPLYQQIKERFSLGPAYHMTHGKNLPGIFAQGALLARNRVNLTGVTDISNPEIQEWRSRKILDISGRGIHDYVPLYFGFKTPMVAAVQAENEKIVFLRWSLDVLDNGGVIISDGNARSDTTSFREFKTIEDLGVLDVAAILAVKYADDQERKRRKQAEILIPDHLLLASMLDIICFSEPAKCAILRHAKMAGITVQVRVNSGWYFGTEVGP